MTQSARLIREPAAHRRTHRIAGLTLVLLALALALLTGASVSLAGNAKPGAPTAKTPHGTITQTTPTFTWSNAARAATYELCVYKGTQLQLKKTGLRKTTWKSSKALPLNVSLTWKVRAANAFGSGAWSRSVAFKVAPPSPAKAITAFSLASPAATGVIDQVSRTVALTVPFGTDVTGLVPTITISGISVSPGSGVATDFTSPVTYTVTAANGTTRPYVVTVNVAANPAKAITAFTFASPSATGVINEALHTIAVTVPYGTDVTALAPTIRITGASVGPASGVATDFTSPVTYTVTAADASTQTYTVTVTVAADPAKAITAFSFASPAATGVINETLHTVALTVPYGTNVSALVPTITITGASVSPASGVATNFTGPVTYVVTAADASTQPYTVTVTVAAATKAITAFSFQGLDPPVSGVINEAARTIALSVRYGTDVSDLVPTVTINGTSVSPASGAAHDFTRPVTYTVTAADGTTQPYVVTVTAILALGDVYGGGKVAYILDSGDFGYSATVQHGLIAAVADQTSSSRIKWALPGFQSAFVPGGTEFWIGTGAANTDRIVAQNGAGNIYAAGLARSYNGGGYSDWYLPSRDELNKLYLNRGWIGGFVSSYVGSGYWSSSEGAADMAWYQAFCDGDLGWSGKGSSNGAMRVRAVRAF